MLDRFNKWFIDDFVANSKDFVLEFGRNYDIRTKVVWKTIWFFHTKDRTKMTPVCKFMYKDDECVIFHYEGASDMIRWTDFYGILSAIEDITGETIYALHDCI